MTGPVRLLRDATAHSAGFVASTLVTFALVPFLVRALPAADYGVWLVSLSASAALGTVSIALWWVVSREVAGADESGDPPRALVADVFAATLIVGCVGALLLYLAATNGLIGTASSDEQRTVLRLAGALFFWEQMAACAVAVLSGRSQFVWLNTIVVGFTMVRAASIVIVLLRGGTLLTVALLHVAFTAIGAVALLGTMLASTPWLRTLRPVAPFSALRVHLRFASQVQFAALISAGTNQLVPLIVSRMFGSAAVVPLYIGLRVPQAVTSLTRRVGEAAYPMLVQLANRGGIDAVRPVVARSVRWAIVLALLAVLALFLTAPLILRFWLGTYPPEALVLFRLTAAAFFFETISLPLDVALMAAGRAGVVLAIVSVTALLQIGTLVWLLRAMGVRAAGIALLASCVLYAVAHLAAADRIGVLRWRRSSA